MLERLGKVEPAQLGDLLVARKRFRAAYGEADVGEVEALLRSSGKFKSAKFALDQAFHFVQSQGVELAGLALVVPDAVLGIFAAKQIGIGWFRALYGSVSMLVQPEELGMAASFNVPAPGRRPVDRFITRLDSLSEPQLQKIARLAAWHELSGYVVPPNVSAAVDAILSDGDAQSIAEFSSTGASRFQGTASVWRQLGDRVGMNEFNMAANWARAFGDEETALERAMLRASIALLAVDTLPSQDFAGLYLPFAAGIPSGSLWVEPDSRLSS